MNKYYIYNKKDRNSCKLCNIGNYFENEERNLTCDNCGYCETVFVEDSPYDEKYYLKNSHYYINHYTNCLHFKKLITIFQAKQDKIINPDIMLKLQSRYNKNSHLKINYSNTRYYLKLLRFPKLYDHIYLINLKLGVNPQYFTEEQENTLMSQFNQIQEIHSDLVKDKKKKNFFNYFYILYKLCQLNEYNKYLDFIPLMKTKTKIDEHESLFEEICKKLKWTFIPLT
jgi:hypothetical protein